MSIIAEIKALAPDSVELRKFGLVVGGVFLAIGAFFAWRGADWYAIPIYIGSPLVVLGAIFPPILKPVYYAWMSLAFTLGWVMTRVILTIAYVLMITPVGLFFRLTGRDALTRKPDREAATYWIDKDYPIADRTRFEKFF
ncbi:MAG: SxtJ family membrane protein [Acidobacteriota bacterium]